MKSSILVLSMIAMVSCSESDFSSGGVGSKKKTEPKAPVKNDTAEPKDSIGDLQGGDGQQELTDDSKCWFAVSGGYFGWDGGIKPKYSPKFPGTTSGKPIGHGESFDTVGGVYLRASSTPYEYQKGNRELDLAVDQSFDSIAIAPGMTVVIKDSAGSMVYEGKGPFMATEQDSGTGSLAGVIRKQPNVQNG